MTSIPRSNISTLSLFALAAVVGCGANSDGPETYPVSGVVMLADQPVAGAVITFQPMSAEPGAMGAQATSGADGAFDVKIAVAGGQSEKEGLPVGEYGVTVTKIETPTTLERGSRPKNELPAKYADVSSSGLTAKVAAAGENLVELKLTP